MNKKDRFKFIGLDFHNYTLGEAISKLEEFIRTGTPHAVFTPTAELIVRAYEDPNLKGIYNHTDLLTIDSFVVYYAARMCRKPVKEPVSAVRLMFNFLPVAQKKGYRLYLLGAKEEIITLTVEKLKTAYPGINIIGWHNGYFDFDNPKDVIHDIQNKKPDVLFVAMSSPLKENFITKNLEILNIPVSIGVGGSFDIIAGKAKLAPPWISRIGFEWFYRLVQEPGRLWRRYLVTNTKFLQLLLQELVT
ncbi:MAG: WecB/TagA/CpsF family glycosyltransferase [Candidatus Omnitrophota bacterium]